MADYGPAWERLKERGKVTLEVEPSMISRVKKGLINKKYKDRAFRAMREDDYYYLDYHYDRSTKRLTVELKRRVGTL